MAFPSTGHDPGKSTYKVTFYKILYIIYHKGILHYSIQELLTVQKTTWYFSVTNSSYLKQTFIKKKYLKLSETFGVMGTHLAEQVNKFTNKEQV